MMVSYKKEASFFFFSQFPLNPLSVVQCIARTYSFIFLARYLVCRSLCPSFDTTCPCSRGSLFLDGLEVFYLKWHASLSLVGLLRTFIRTTWSNNSSWRVSITSMTVSTSSSSLILSFGMQPLLVFSAILRSHLFLALLFFLSMWWSFWLAFRPI